MHKVKYEVCKKIAIALLAFTSLARADVEAVNVILRTEAQTRYTVPAGKILIIESVIWALDPDSTLERLVISPANRPPGFGDLQINNPDENDNIFAPIRPIRLIGGGNASISINPLWNDLMISGLLVDQEDLSACDKSG